MKTKHLRARIQQCVQIGEASNCPRRKFGAMLIDPERNTVIMDAYNGGPRGGGDLCGGKVCLRNIENVVSGTKAEVGCHHAEMNVICNTAAANVSSRGAHLIVTGEPCMMCAKLIHHAGITRVYIVEGGFRGDNGVSYLETHDIAVELVDGPQDPRV